MSLPLARGPTRDDTTGRAGRSCGHGRGPQKTQAAYTAPDCTRDRTGDQRPRAAARGRDRRPRGATGDDGPGAGQCAYPP
eukprot:8417459-Pyramimonas_sp.AAC.1